VGVSHFLEIFRQWLAVIAFVRGEDLQFAREAAGELSTHIHVTSFPGCRPIRVYDRLYFSIDNFRCFNGLNAVVRAIAVVIASGDISYSALHVSVGEIRKRYHLSLPLHTSASYLKMERVYENSVVPEA
jgi:hypothetical protein